LAENGHLTFFSQWENVNFSIAQIYAGILFIEQGSGDYAAKETYVTLKISNFIDY